jgi:hypothetical protein
MNPSAFKIKPWSSVAQKSETESIATNIMIILSRTGDAWRELSWEEYSAERIKDAGTDEGGGFSEWREKPHFERTVPFTTSEANARLFSPAWMEVGETIEQ